MFICKRIQLIVPFLVILECLFFWNYLIQMISGNERVAHCLIPTLMV